MLFISHHKKIFYNCLRVFVFVFLCVFGATTVNAQDAAAISQGFQTKETNIVTGAIVAFEPGSQAAVQLANIQRVGQLAGVIGDKTLIEIRSKNKEVQVVLNGTTPALVSNLNGDIKSGDRITASPIDGVGMKATVASQVIGTAETDFKNIPTVESTINDRNGKPQVIRTGLLPTQVNVTYFTPEEKKTSIPPFLQQFANVVGGRNVSPARALTAALALLMGFISIGVLLYSSVRSSIISIGRNPLSENAVHKSLIEIGLTAIGILLVMVIAIYLILKT